MQCEAPATSAELHSYWETYILGFHYSLSVSVVILKSRKFEYRKVSEDLRIT